jgi:hypothetical protein
MSRRARAGFTVVEAMIALVIIGLVLTKLTLVVDQARRAHEEESVCMALDDQALELIDRIAYALYGSDPQKITPFMETPLPASEIHFQVSMGVEDGEPVWSDPEVIGLTEQGDAVYWGENLGEAGERVVVWANTVSELLQDEVLNGVDDNGNELADELGLAFVMDGKSITIRLTLERVQDDEKSIQVTRETTVTCRN